MAAYRDANATAPAHGSASVTPSDATVFPVTRAVYVGGTGDLSVRMADGMTQLYVGVPVGIFSIQVDQVLATGTTATSIVALY